MYWRRSVWITLSVITLAALPLLTAGAPLSLIFTPHLRTYSAKDEFVHQTGRPRLYGWETRYRRDRPGFLIQGFQQAESSLFEGTYRYDFYFLSRPGHFSHLLSRANDAVRLEVMDVTRHEVVMDRTFQRTDFKNDSEKQQVKSVTFSTWRRSGHIFEPRVYWPGLCGISLERVVLVPLGTISLENLQEKTALLNKMMPRQFIDRGYVVTRDAQGQAADTEDAAIWTGLYIAEEAWRYERSNAPSAADHMEQSLWAMHALFQKSSVPGTMVRFVDRAQHPSLLPASKDTYTGFFYALGQSWPAIRDPALKATLRLDLEKAADHFVVHDLSFTPRDGPAVDLNPYPSATFVENALRRLQNDPALCRHLIKAIRWTRWYFWIHGETVPSSFAQLSKTLHHPTEKTLNRDLLPFLNDVRHLLPRLERHIHHAAMRGVRQGLRETPYYRLDQLLLRIMNNLDRDTEAKPFTSFNDLTIFPSESLHALHFLKVASERLPKPNRFETYYYANLYQGKALLRTAIQWHQLDEELASTLLGKTEADTRRTSSAHLSFLALHDLIHLEKDPHLRKVYRSLFEEQFGPMQSDGNAMIDAMQATLNPNAIQAGLALWSLDRYPTDRRGKGDRYWQDHRAQLLATYGGELNHQARDVVPPDVRPRDAFLWQRSAHSIRGDQEGWLYPPLDYLFAYWLVYSTLSLNNI